MMSNSHNQITILIRILRALAYSYKYNEKKLRRNFISLLNITYFYTCHMRSPLRPPVFSVNAFTRNRPSATYQHSNQINKSLDTRTV